MRKISILFLIDQMKNMGGAEKNLINLITHIDCRRFSVFLYTFDLASPLREVMENNNIPCQQIPYPTTFQGIRQFIVLSKKIRAQKINILHSYFEGSDIWGTLLAKLSGIPVIVSSKRDMGFSKNKKILAIYRFINPFITRVISVSDAVKYQVNRQEKVSLDKIVTIYNGVDLAKFTNSNHKKDLKAKLHLNSSSPIVGVLANIRPIKGMEFFIHAAAIVLNKFPRVNFVIIGDCLPSPECAIYYKKLKSLIQDLNLGNNFFFLGQRTDIPEMLSIMDISVLPSLSEGFSNTVIESMAAGKPVVVTDVGGNPEAVVHNKTGFVVPPQNVDLLAQAISTLLANKKLAKSMSEAGRLRVKELFSMQTMIRKIENLYISTLN
jgi:glycosyltransferase involved in cell wall biosynthesis